MAVISPRTAELALRALQVTWRQCAPRLNGMAMPDDWRQAFLELSAEASSGSPERTEIAEMQARAGQLLLSTDEAARRLNITRRAVQKRCATGLLPAKRVGRSWMVEWQEAS